MNITTTRGFNNIQCGTSEIDTDFFQRMRQPLDVASTLFIMILLKINPSQLKQGLVLEVAAHDIILKKN